MTYNALGQLESITDVVGITTTFEYSPYGDVITKMTTPYGDTRFGQGEGGSGGMRWVEAIDPLGARERVETYLGQVPDNCPVTEPITPTGMNVYNDGLDLRNTFHWSKKALSEIAFVDIDGDGWSDPMTSYESAHVTHWPLAESDTTIATIPASEKAPLESRVWYQYEGQSTPTDYQGTSASAVKIGRVLDAQGTTQLHQFTYGLDGKVLTSIDPLGRETKHTYQVNGTTGTANRIQTEQKNDNAGYDVLASMSGYDARDLPSTVTDAAGQVVSYTYNTDGQPETVTRTRNGVPEVTTYHYYGDTAPSGSRRRLHKVEGPGGVLLRSFTYDAAGRVRSVANSDGYAVTHYYDELDRPLRSVYPDGTYEDTIYALDKLEAEWQRDRQGRWTRTEYNAGRQLVKVTDPAGWG